MLARVDVTRDAYGCMLSHALSTESEEIMGLLCGARSLRACVLLCS
jgi:proteasome lid subunit RPN8/RPN11